MTVSAGARKAGLPGSLPGLLGLFAIHRADAFYLTNAALQSSWVGNAEIETRYREFCASNAVRLLDVPRQVFENAVQLRAETGFKTRAPLRAAADIKAACSLFIANDTDFRRVQGRPVVVLDDLL